MDEAVVVISREAEPFVEAEAEKRLRPVVVRDIGVEVARSKHVEEEEADQKENARAAERQALTRAAEEQNRRDGGEVLERHLLRKRSVPEARQERQG